MKSIKVQIKERDKGTKDLSLLNLRDEVVNFLYKDTVALSTKIDLQFFLLLYFVVVRIGNKTFLEKILDEGLPKFNNLNRSFASNKSYLRSGQYRKMVEEHGLSELFESDIFFVLIEAVINVGEIEKRYQSFLLKHSDIRDTINTIASTYTPELRKSFKGFQSKRIKNDRTDDYGNTHDLSMSVYRMVRMRNSRNLDLNLQRYTSVRELTSESPIILTFLQHVDPQLIFDLWSKYHVTEYARSIVGQVIEHTKNHVDMKVNLGDLVNAWLIYKLIPGKNHKEKDKAFQEFEESKKRNSQALDDLTLRLVDSVLKSDQRREKEVENLRSRVRKLTGQDFAMQDKTEIKKLEERIAQLENLIVSAEVIDDDRHED